MIKVFFEDFGGFIFSLFTRLSSNIAVWFNDFFEFNKTSCLTQILMCLNTLKRNENCTSCFQQIATPKPISSFNHTQLN